MASPRGVLRPRGNKTPCFLRGESLSALLYFPTQNWLAHKFAAVSRSTSWWHVWVESSSCSPWELVSFVRPRQLVSYDPRHVTRSPPIRKRIGVARYNNKHNDWPQGKQWVLFPRDPCFTENLNVSRGEAERNIEVEGKRNSLFPAGPVSECFVTLPTQNKQKTAKEIVCFTLLTHKFAAVSRSTPYGASEFWSPTRDAFSSNRKTYLSWEV